MDFTVEVYKEDKRVRSGRRFVKKVEVEADCVEEVFERLFRDYPESGGYSLVVKETWVIRKNMMTGKEYRERYDTPRYCSPSSESYWSM